MKFSGLYSLTFVLIIVLQTFAQDVDYKNYSSAKRYSFSVYGTYVSSATLQNQPLSGDPFERGAETELNGSYGYGAELNFYPKIGETNLVFFISTEYYHIKEKDIVIRLQGDSTVKSVRTNEDISMIPIEAGIKWDLPVGFNNFKIYIGGGGGVYLGNRLRSIGSLEPKIISNKPGFSLNVLAGAEYFVSKSISIDGQFKFREATFDVNSEYNTETIIIEGKPYKIETPFYSRVNVDGVRISLGLNYHF